MGDIILTLFGFMVLCLFIFLCIYTIVSNIKKYILDIKNAKKKYTPVLTDIYKIVEFYEGEKLLTKKDFIIKNKYYNHIKPGKYVTEYIEDLAAEIFDYLNISSKLNVVVLYDENDRYTSKRQETGYYRSNKVTRDIHIIVKKDYDCEDIAAILCHEITHYYMELIGLEYSNKIKNEEATDVLSIMLGFGEIMINGYREHRYEMTVGVNIVRKYTSKIGYISQRDCKVIYSLFKKMKKCEIEKKKAELILNETIRNVTKKLALTKELYDSFLIVAQNKTANNVNKNDIVKIQDLYLKIENGYFILQIEQFNNVLTKKLSKEELEELSKKIDLLCCEITTNSSFLANC